MAEKIESILLIGSQLRLHVGGQVRGLDASKFRDSLAKQLGFRQISKPVQRALVEMGGMKEIDPLRHGRKTIQTQVSECFMRSLHGRAIQLDPAAVGQFDK